MHLIIVAMIYLLYRVSIAKLGSILAGAELIAAPRPTPKLRLGLAYIRSRSLLWAMIVKDIKLLSKT